MIALILAAGRGTRLQPITDKIPKPLIRINDKSLIMNVLESLPEKIDKIVIVINYLGQMIIDKIGYEFRGIQIHYVWQDNLIHGTMGAVISAKSYIDNDFLVLCSDNIYEKDDLAELIKIPDSYLIKEVDDIEKSQIYPHAKYTILDHIPEKSIVLDAGAWFLNKDFVNHKPAMTENLKEIGIPHTMKYASLIDNTQYNQVYAHKWFPVGDFVEIDIVEKLLKVKVNY